jgi:uncharacterized protein
MQRFKSARRLHFFFRIYRLTQWLSDLRLREHLIMHDNVSQPERVETTAEEKTVRVTRLLDLYGGLLTPKQLHLARLHYDKDMSFSEIARGQSVSRQAVHDAVRHAEKVLEEYEAKLRLLKHGHRGAGKLPAMEQLRERLEGLKNKVAHRGIIYSSDWIVSELNDALKLLEGTQPEV